MHFSITVLSLLIVALGAAAPHAAIDTSSDTSHDNTPVVACNGCSKAEKVPPTRRNVLETRGYTKPDNTWAEGGFGSIEFCKGENSTLCFTFESHGECVNFTGANVFTSDEIKSVSLSEGTMCRAYGHEECPKYDDSHVSLAVSAGHAVKYRTKWQSNQKILSFDCYHA